MSRWIALALFAGTLALFSPTLGHQFVNYDDDSYVTANPHVQGGLTASNLRHAFSGVHHATWHPVTTLTHLLDVELFGLDPRGHHATSVLLHALNAVLLFWLFLRMTGAAWPSALLAALFAWHPLHVESVAWVSARKDLVSLLFGLLTILAYVRFTESRSALRYTLVVAVFALALMAKPMLVTLPFVLMLLDRWPLGGDVRVTDKLPLLALSAVACAITLLTQADAGAVRPTTEYALDVRLGNAIVAWATYLGKTVWPVGLAPFYPHPGDTLSGARVAASAMLLLGISGGVLALQRQRFLFTGWAWYLGTLVPVIGIVQVGDQAIADRYTYLPLIGLFIMVVWGVAALLETRPAGRRPALVLGGVVLAALAWTSWRQIAHWQDGTTLFAHAVRVTEPSFVAQHGLGTALLERGRLREADEHLSIALRLHPDHPATLNNLGIVRAQDGQLREARALFRRALELEPDDPDALANLGNTFLDEGAPRRAATYYERVLELAPDHVRARVALAKTFLALGQPEEARAQLDAALLLDPAHPEARALRDRIP